MCIENVNSCVIDHAKKKWNPNNVNASLSYLDENNENF